MLSILNKRAFIIAVCKKCIIRLSLLDLWIRSVNADLKLTHFCSERRFKSDTPPLHLPTAYAAGAVSRLAFTIPAAR
jgi:hypothetical protein